MESHTETLDLLPFQNHLAHQEFTTAHKSVNPTRQTDLQGIYYLRRNTQVY